MKLSLGQAAKEAGVSKATISRAVKTGKISAEKVGNQYQIDPSELFRVYPRNVSETDKRDDTQPPYETEKDVEIRMLRELLDAKDKHIASVEGQLLVVNQKLLTISSPASSPIPEPRGLWSRLFR